jgi:hypothetical protein
LGYLNPKEGNREYTIEMCFSLRKVGNFELTASVIPFLNKDRQVAAGKFPARLKG